MLDEMVVTKSTLPKVEWSLPKENMKLDLSRIDTGPIAVLGAVSRERGIEHIMLFEKSVNIPKFKVFLEELR